MTRGAASLAAEPELEVVSQPDGTVSQAWDGHVPNHVRTSVRARTQRIECR
jgi:hypothetical protein